MFHLEQQTSKTLKLYLEVVMEKMKHENSETLQPLANLGGAILSEESKQ